MKTIKRFEDFAVSEAYEKGAEDIFEVPNLDMMPTLRAVKDTVTVQKPRRPLKINDVVLYRNDAGELILSRIVYINDGKYSLSCDGQKETVYNISENQIVGVMTSFERKNKTVAADDKLYEFYVKALPVVKAFYSFYSSLREKVKNFINYLSDK